MAVENKYVDPFVVAGTSRVSQNCDPIFCGGKKRKTLIQQVVIAVADNNGSIYRVFRNVSSEARLLGCRVANSVITAGTSYSLGIANVEFGSVISANALANAMDMSAAAASFFAGKNGLANVALTNLGKKLFELAGHNETTKKEAYDIVLTATTVGSSGGNIAILLDFAED